MQVGSLYYDPSYGMKYSSITEWEDDLVNGAIAGFFKEEPFEKPDGSRSIKLIVRKNSNKLEIKEE